MEPAVVGWRNELKNYFRSIENLTEKALLMIKRDRIQNDLPFDDAFKKYFLDRTNSCITNVYIDVSYEECLEVGQTLSNNATNHQEDGNAVNGSISSGSKLALNSTISPESIDHLPIVLEQSNNSNFTSSANVNTTAFARGDNQSSGQIVIFVPSNQLSSAPSELEVNRNSEREANVERTESMVEDEPRVENEIVNEPLIETHTNGNNENVSLVVNGMAVESTSTGANGQKYRERKQETNSKELQPETIDLTSDQEEEDVVHFVGYAHDGQTKPNVQYQKIRQGNSAQNSNVNNNFNPLLIRDNNRISHQTDKNNKMTNTGANEMNMGSTPIRVNGSVKNDVAGMSASIALDECHSEDVTIAESDDDHHTINQTTIQTSQTKSMNSRNGMEMNLSTGKQVSNITEEVGNNSPGASGYLKENSNSAKAANTMKGRHKCDYCEYSTERKSDLIRHIRTHTNERPYECEICEKRFTQKFALGRHMKTHRAMFAFQCSNCRQGFTQKKQLKLHGGRCNAKGYECHLCKRVFIEKQNLSNHMRKHTGEKLRCTKCRKQFGYKSNLTTHMKMHGKLFRFQCSNCRQGFTQKTPWKLHESRCKSKQYECYLCRKKFHQQKGHLLYHMRYEHNGEKPFSCSDCRKRFYSKSHLKYHAKRCR